MQDDIKNSKRRTARPAQMLYVPPAQRNRRTRPSLEKKSEDVQIELSSSTEKIVCNTNVVIDETLCNGMKKVDLHVEPEILPQVEIEQEKPEEKVQEKAEPDKEKSLVIMLNDTQKSDRDAEQEEMQRAIVNINRKSRPLIKHVNVGKNDILHIDVVESKPKRASKPKLNASNIDSWEDLLNEEDACLDEDINEVTSNKKCDEFNSSDEDSSTTVIRNRNINDLDHVIELYDFPASFKSQDIMQLYHDVHKDAYLKWCDDTHALLVFSTPAVAKKALQMDHGIIKARPIGQASAIAAMTVSKSDLKPAMKRPPTTMQTARRLITSHLGTKSRVSKEEQEKERELLKQAKALKLAQRQSERDAWEGNPRPSTA